MFTFIFLHFVYYSLLPLCLKRASIRMAAEEGQPSAEWAQLPGGGSRCTKHPHGVWCESCCIHTFGSWQYSLQTLLQPTDRQVPSFSHTYPSPSIFRAHISWSLKMNSNSYMCFLSFFKIIFHRLIVLINVLSLCICILGYINSFQLVTAIL